MFVLGLHHVTLISSDIRRTIDFYTQRLGLRLVKKTVNLDNPGSYHLYFSDPSGKTTPITFFEWRGTGCGQSGIGGIHHFAWQVPDDVALLQWKRRLMDAGTAVSGPFNHAYFRTISFHDPDGALLEIATPGPDWTTAESVLSALQPGANLGPSSPGAAQNALWPEPVADITPHMALSHGLHHVTLITADPERTHTFYSGLLGLQRVQMAINSTGEGEMAHACWRINGSQPATFISYLERKPVQVGHARMGAGQTHHLAFTVPDENTQLEWREKLLSAGQRVTAVLDRVYFKSIYTHDPDGRLIELATAGPGLQVDEAETNLGQHLQLPEWLEAERSAIEAALPPLPSPDATIRVP